MKKNRFIQGICGLMASMLWLCYPLASVSQHIAYKNYDVADGLPTSNLYRVFKDSKGYIWFCTDYGLSRFDGKTFKNYTEADGLSNNNAGSMGEDQQGNLYVSCMGKGINVLTSKGRFKPLVLKKGKIPDWVLYYMTDTCNRMWIMDKEWKLYYIKDNILTQVDLDPGLTRAGKQLVVMRFYQGVNTGILFATSNGLYKLAADGKITRAPQVPKNEMLVTLDADKAGNIWLAGEGKITKINKDGSTLVFKTGTNESIFALKSTADGRTWFSTPSQGLFYIDHDKVFSAAALFKPRKLLVNYIDEDFEGNLWLADFGSGAYCVNTFNILNYNVEDSLATNYITSLYEDKKGIIWAGGIGGLSAIKDGKVLFLKNNAIRATEQAISVIEKDGGYWVASGNTIYKTGVDMSLVSKTEMPATLLYTDVNNTVWIANGQCIMNYDDNRGFYHNRKLAILDNQRIRCFINDKKGSMWMATDIGLVKLTGDKLEFFNQKNSAIPSDNVSSICFDEKGVMWVGTAEGLCRFDGQHFTSFGIKDGLMNKICNAVASDGKGNIWVGTKKGLYKYNGAVFTWYNMQKGLLADEVNKVLVDAKGNVWAGTVKGLTCILPVAQQESNTTPRIYIQELQINDSVTQLSNGLTIKGGQGNIKISFCGISYRNAGAVNYQYRLGNTDKWIETNNTNVEYAGLAPGSYSFMVRARKENGPWGTPSVFNFSVLAPVWQRLWFIALFSLTVLALLYLLVRLWVRKFKERELQKIKMMRRAQFLKQQALTALLNPHFVFNALNSIQHFITEYDKKSANEYLADFARLVRRTMEDSTHLYVPLSNELDRLELYLSLEKLRFGDSLNYEIQIDPEIDTDDIIIPCMLIQPYVENSIWHGIMPKKEGGHIAVRINAMAPDILRITIEDDGIGVDTLKTSTTRHFDEHKPRGMQIMKERIALLSQMVNKEIFIRINPITDENETVCGTRIEIDLPLELKPILNEYSLLE